MHVRAKAFSCACTHYKTMRTCDVVRVLSEIILYEMGKEDLTSREMAKRCGISKRKLDGIIYREDKGLTVGILLKVCKGVGIELCLNYKTGRAV